MPDLTAMTIEQLRSATKAEILAGIRDYLAANYTRRDLIRLCRDRDTYTETTDTTRPDGQIFQRIEIERDGDTQAQVSRRVITWTYYATGEVNVITIERYDAINTLIRTKRIKHYRDGRQPEATES